MQRRQNGKLHPSGDSSDVIAWVQLSSMAFLWYIGTDQELITVNSVVVAEFFNHVYETFFSEIIRSGDAKGGILGPISNHYRFVESRGRGMLHLHALL